MPIKFRCVYCEQLLGIARRKAGTVVKCPNCAGQLIVPAPDASNLSEENDKDDATAAAPELEVAASRQAATTMKPSGDAGATEGSLLFERNDFDELLRPMQEKRTTASRSNASKPAPAPAPESYDAPAMQPLIAPKPALAARKGILLTPLRLALVLVFVIAGFAISFAAGLLIGKFVLGK